MNFHCLKSYANALYENLVVEDTDLKVSVTRKNSRESNFSTC